MVSSFRKRKLEDKQKKSSFKCKEKTIDKPVRIIDNKDK